MVLIYNCEIQDYFTIVDHLLILYLLMNIPEFFGTVCGGGGRGVRLTEMVRLAVTSVNWVCLTLPPPPHPPTSTPTNILQHPT